MSRSISNNWVDITTEEGPSYKILPVYDMPPLPPPRPLTFLQRLKAKTKRTQKKDKSQRQRRTQTTYQIKVKRTGNRINQTIVEPKTFDSKKLDNFITKSSNDISQRDIKGIRKHINWQKQNHLNEYNNWWRKLLPHNQYKLNEMLKQVVHGKRTKRRKSKRTKKRISKATRKR